MEEPGVRRRFEAIDTNANVSDNDNAMADQASASAPAAKKAKTAPRILTFKVHDSPVKVQVLSTQTLYDLVDILCRETTIGAGESVDDHMWKITLPGGKVYESEHVPCQSKLRANKTLLSDLDLVPKKSTMTLHYDYGDFWEYEITCEETNQDDNNSSHDDPIIIDESLFPRRKPAAVPKGFILYETQQVDLNVLFPTFNKWVFQGGRTAELNLFQPGRKQNFGFVERGSRHMLYLPCKAGNDLSEYLHCFDVAAKRKHGGMTNWFSVVVLPKEHSATLANRYSRDLEAGFIEMRVASFPPTMPLINSAFPNSLHLLDISRIKRFLEDG
ncbi:hypothetical protein MHU86_2374 [Fragilaria crotonensis]|nr:hypothetical protein MHU86_2374 [Fragilaria crotonensis]